MQENNQTLPKERLEQLDNNIKNMLDNGASQEDVIRYAADFREKFSAEITETNDAAQAKPKDEQPKPIRVKPKQPTPAMQAEKITSQMTDFGGGIEPEGLEMPKREPQIPLSKKKDVGQVGSIGSATTLREIAYQANPLSDYNTNRVKGQISGVETPKPNEFVQKVQDIDKTELTGVYEDRLSAIDNDLMMQTEENVVARLNYLFGADEYGFQFKERIPGIDQMEVIAPNGKTKRINLDAFTEKNANQNRILLQSFMKANMPDERTMKKVEAVGSKKFKSEEERKEAELDIDKNWTKVANDISAYNMAVESFGLDYDEFFEKEIADIEAKVQSGEMTQEQAKKLITDKSKQFEKRIKDIEAFSADISKKAEGYSGSEEAILNAISKYDEMKLRQGGAEILSRKLESGINSMVAGIYRTPEFVYDLAVQGYNTLLEGQDALFGKDSVLGSGGSRLPTSKQLGEKLGIQNEFAKTLELRNEKLLEIATRYDGSITDYIMEGEYLKASAATAMAITESLPFTFAVMVPGMAGGSAMQSFVGITGAMGANRKQELLDRDDLTETQKNANALMYGMAEGFEALIGSGSFGRTLRKIAQKEGISKARQFAANTMANVMKDNPALAPFKEALQEGTTTLLQNISDIVINKEEKSITEGLADSFIVGGVMGGGFATVQSAVQYAVTADERKERKDFKKYMKTIRALSTSGDVYQKTIDNINEQVDEMLITPEKGEALKRQVTESVSAYNSMPDNFTEKQKEEAMGLMIEKKRLEQTIEGKDPVLVEKEKARIAEINIELQKVAKLKKEETDAVQEQQAETLDDGEQARDSEGVESEVSEQAEVSEASEEVAATETEGVAEEVEALKDVESTAKALEGNKDVVSIAENILSFSIKGLKRFFHGSGAKRSGRLYVSNAPQFGTGIYFSTSKDLVESEFGENITEVAINAKNPVFTNTKEWNDVVDLALKKANEGKERDEDGDIINEETDYYEIKSSFISDAAKELGHDVIIDEGSADYENEIVVLKDEAVIYDEDIPLFVSEAYHKAKADGSNPELVKAVEKLLGAKEAPKPLETKEEVEALKDVESTAKALEDVDTQPLKTQLGIEANWDMIGEGDALSGKSPILAYTQKQLPDWNIESQKGNINPNSKITYDIPRTPATSSKTLPSGYVLEGRPEVVNKEIAYAKDENGVIIGMVEIETLKDGRNGIRHIAVAPEFRGKGVADKLIQTLKENNPQLDLSKTKLRSKGFEKAFGNKIISEAYHKAKADGSNPELVKAVEKLLGAKETTETQPTTQDEAKTETTEAQQKPKPKFFKKKPKSRDVVIIDIEKIKKEKPKAYNFLSKYKGHESFEAKDIRNALSIAYTRMMRYESGAKNLIDEISELEDILEDVEAVRKTSKEEFKKQAKESGDFNESQLNVFNNLVDALNTDFMPEYDSHEESLKFVGIDSKINPNFYSLSDNILSAKDPVAFIHEIGHFAFYNILTKGDRLKFLNYMVETSYGKDGKPLKERLAMTSEKVEVVIDGKEMVYDTNVGDDFNEYFAEQFRQWYLKEKVTPKEFDSIFEKVANYLRSIVEKLRRGEYIDKNIIEFFDKIIPTTETTEQVGQEEAEVKAEEKPKTTPKRKPKPDAKTEAEINAAKEALKKKLAGQKPVDPTKTKVSKADFKQQAKITQSGNQKIVKIGDLIVFQTTKGKPVNWDKAYNTYGKTFLSAKEIAARKERALNNLTKKISDYQPETPFEWLLQYFTLGGKIKGKEGEAYETKAEMWTYSEETGETIDRIAEMIQQEMGLESPPADIATLYDEVLRIGKDAARKQIKDIIDAARSEVTKKLEKIEERSAEETLSAEEMLQRSIELEGNIGAFEKMFADKEAFMERFDVSEERYNEIKNIYDKLTEQEKQELDGQVSRTYEDVTSDSPFRSQEETEVGDRDPFAGDTDFVSPFDDVAPTEKEAAKAELDAAKKAFDAKIRGGLQSGGLNALPEFVRLVKAYIKSGAIEVADIIKKIKSDIGDLNVSPKELVDAVAFVKERVDVEAKIKSDLEAKLGKKIDALKEKAKSDAEVRKAVVDFISENLTESKGYLKSDITKLSRLAARTTVANLEKVKERITDVAAEASVRAKERVEKEKAARKAAEKEIKDEFRARIEATRQKAADAKSAREALREFIRDGLPKDKGYSDAFVKKMNNKIATVTPKNFARKTSEILSDINAERERIKTSKIKEIYEKVKNAAKIVTTKSGIRKGTKVDADYRSYLVELAKVLRAVKNQDADAMLKILDAFSDPVKIADIQNRVAAGEKITPDERQLLNSLYAYNTFGDIASKSLEDVEAISADVEAAIAQARENLKADVQKRVDKRKAIQKEAREHVDKLNPKLYGVDKDGNRVLLSSEDLSLNRKSIIQWYRDNGIWGGLKEWVKNYRASHAAMDIRNSLNFMKTLETLTNIIDNPIKKANFFRDKIYDKLASSETKMLAKKQEYRKALNKFASEALGKGKTYRDIKKKLRGVSMDIDFVSSNTGLTQTSKSVNADVLMKLYSWWQNAETRELMINRGITEKTMAAIEAKLGSDVTAFADKVVDYLTNKDYYDINNVFKELNYVNLPFNDNYFPRESFSNKVESGVLEKGDLSRMFSAQNESSLKDRSKNVTLNLFGSGFTDILENHMQSMSKYKAYAIPVSEINDVMNTPDVDTMLRSLGLRSLYRHKIAFSISPDAFKTNEINSKVMGFIQSSFTAISLGFKLMQIPKQMTSFVNAFPAYQATNKGKMFIVDFPAFLVEYASVLATLPSSFRKAYEMSPDFKERILDHLGGKLARLESGIDTREKFFNKNSKLGDIETIFRAIQSSPTAIGDILGVLGYLAVYNSEIRRGVPKEKALKNFAEYNTTQQSKRAMDMISLQANPNIVTRAIMTFMSSQVLYLNKSMQSAKNIGRSISNGQAPKAFDTRTLLINLAISNAIFAAMSNIFKLIGGDDEDTEEALKEVGIALTGANTLYSMPFAGYYLEKVVSDIAEKPYSPDLALDPLQRAISEAKKEIKSGKSSVEAWGKQILQLATKTDFTPFIAFAKEVQGEGETEKNLYEMIGVAKSYRPWQFDWDRDAETDLKEAAKLMPFLKDPQSSVFQSEKLRAELKREQSYEEKKLLKQLNIDPKQLKKGN
jgi:GNAT superfamily N-acetyltransferase